MVKVGVILSGCGFLDGTEIHEAVITLLALDRAGVEVACMAPDADQMHVIDHLSGVEASETRNVLVESARIARGEITDIKEVSADELDALVVPGGFGAAKNLSSFATEGSEAAVHPEVSRLLGEMLDARKPLGVICIAPAVLAAVLRGSDRSAQLTIGLDEDTAAALRSMGATHVDCSADKVHTDEELRVVSTPAYMLATSITETADGIEMLVDELLAMASEPV